MQPLAGTMRRSPSTPSVEEIFRRIAATQDRKSLLHSNGRTIDALMRLDNGCDALCEIFQKSTINTVPLCFD
jgi:hypothetical protein